MVHSIVEDAKAAYMKKLNEANELAEEEDDEDEDIEEQWAVSKNVYDTTLGRINAIYHDADADIDPDEVDAQEQ